MLAQFTTIEDPTGTLNSLWPIFAIALPFLQARFQSAEARAWFKFGVAVAFAVLAAALSLLQQDWGIMLTTPEGVALVLERVLQVFGLAYGVYFTTDRLVDGLNEQPVMAPDRGFGG